MELSFANLDDVWMEEAASEDEENDFFPNKKVHQLCRNAKPSDFYFGMKVDDDIVIISVAPKLYFDKFGYQFDQTLPIDHLLPGDFAEEMESVYGCDRNFDDIKRDMLDRGFVKNNKFDTLMSEDYD